jgi:hypothetical protein
MAAARGDRKPCTHGDCAGTMQFGREPIPQTSAIRVDGERGWVCSEKPEHFLLASHRADPDGSAPDAVGGAHS